MQDAIRTVFAVTDSMLFCRVVVIVLCFSFRPTADWQLLSFFSNVICVPQYLCFRFFFGVGGRLIGSQSSSPQAQAS